MRKIKELFRRENGNVLLLASVALMGLLAIAGLVIDGSKLYMTKAELQKIANAAALSGAQELTVENESVVRMIVDEVIAKHDTEATLENVEIVMNDYVKVSLKDQVSLTFSTILGIDYVDITADAKASLGVMGRAFGAAPLGISDSLELIYGEKYYLKVGSGDSEYGNFGILALEGPGASTYEDTFRNGYSEELKVGDIINTESGNVVGKTSLVVQEKINSCSDPTERDCERIILVPVYRPYENDSNKIKQVQITGFAYFYIEDPMDERGTVPGVFIRRTGTGFTETGAVDRGAYSIRLTE
ncbi:pilus assembly protein TadG-related protein [Ornithinibacillus californiensis]|uniref:pilus assembly protein TadG-related protein n=1 Tax=Ornithinibacillus californiensis TaxID=161536 RepID=UPI00064DB477|nr:Tad domain-containing protein [Ornithinibacillus californiensis]